MSNALLQFYFYFTNFIYFLNLNFYHFFLFLITNKNFARVSGNFQLSPDFRQRASSNASSVGRLSPIPSLAIENDWDYTLVETDTAKTQLLEDLAGTLADELTLQNVQSELFNGSVLIAIHFHHLTLH
jgi:hypothetical protein